MLKRMRAKLAGRMSELKRRHKIDEAYARCLNRVSHFIVTKVIECNLKKWS